MYHVVITVISILCTVLIVDYTQNWIIVKVNVPWNEQCQCMDSASGRTKFSFALMEAMAESVAESADDEGLQGGSSTLKP
jgi:hypothetical protein